MECNFSTEWISIFFSSLVYCSTTTPYTFNHFYFDAFKLKKSWAECVFSMLFPRHTYMDIMAMDSATCAIAIPFPEIIVIKKLWFSSVYSERAEELAN